MSYEDALEKMPPEDRRLLYIDELLFGESFIRVIDGIPRRVAPKDIPADWREVMKEKQA